MSEQDIVNLQKGLQELREEVRRGFRELREWKSEAEVGMTGNEHHGVWGYKQKIDHVQKTVREIRLDVDNIEMKVNKIIWTTIGASAVAGALSALIFMLAHSLITSTGG